MSPFDPDAPDDGESDDELLLHALTHASSSLHLLARLNIRKGKGAASYKLIAWCVDGAIDSLEARLRLRTQRPGGTIPSPRPATTSRC